MLDDNLKNDLNQISVSVEPVIRELLTKDVEEKNAELAFYQCSVGGKRIRPALVVFSGQIFGGNINDLLHPAASVEVLHNSTLIIDDIIDHSESRRDQPTCWYKYGKSIAECTSFIYLASVFEGLNNSNNSQKLIQLFSKTLKIIIDGEIKDILFERSGRIDEDFVVKNRYKIITKDDYFQMIGQKTAVLLQASCQAGAICANANDEQINAIGDYGYNLGMAFQIRDDLLDIFGEEKEFGKKIGKDIIEKKMGNFVILLALDKLDEQDKNTIISLLESSSEVTDNDVEQITSIIKKTDAKSNAETVADSYIQAALESLQKLPSNEYTEKLKGLAGYIVSRSK